MVRGPVIPQPLVLFVRHILRVLTAFVGRAVRQHVAEHLKQPLGMAGGSFPHTAHHPRPNGRRITLPQITSRYCIWVPGWRRLGGRAERGAETMVQDKITDAAGQAMEAAGPYLAQAKEMAGPLMEQAIAMASPLMDQAGPLLEQAVAGFEQLVETAGPYLEQAVTLIGPAAAMLHDKAGPMFEQAKEVAAPYLEQAAPFIEQAGVFATKGIESVGELVSGVVYRDGSLTA